MEYKTISKNPIITSCSILTILKNVLLSYALTLFMFLIFAFVITYTDISHNSVSVITVIITILSIMIAGILNGRKSTEKGWLTGCVTGLLYMGILYILGSIIYKNPGIHANGIAMIITGIISGALGSIIGINNKKKTR